MLLSMYLPTYKFFFQLIKTVQTQKLAAIISVKTFARDNVDTTQIVRLRIMLQCVLVQHVIPVIHPCRVVKWILVNNLNCTYYLLYFKLSQRIRTIKST